MDSIIILIFQLVVLLGSVIIHEVSHGLAALRLGDETAKMAGRLTLNPVKHLELSGSFLVPLILFLAKSPVILGWAKPVPYNPHYLYKDYKYGPLKVALAGPLSNILLALVAGFIIRAADSLIGAAGVAFLGFVVFLNLLLAVFNLIPVPPLDGSKILGVLLPPRYAWALEGVSAVGLIIIFALLLFSFNYLISFTYFIFNLLVGDSAAAAFLHLFGR
jgi:Zn-dependent protease